MRLGMYQQPALKMELRQSYAATIFPAVDCWLDRHPEIVPKNADKYRHRVDCWYAEVVGGEWKKRCFAFYRGNDEPLQKVLTTKKIVLCQDYLLLACKIASVSAEDKLTLSMKDLRLILHIMKQCPI